jgi:hypothetical protein
MTANSRKHNSQNSKSTNEAKIDQEELNEWREWAEKWITEQTENDEKGLID